MNTYIESSFTKSYPRLEFVLVVVVEAYAHPRALVPLVVLSSKVFAGVWY